MNNGVPAMLSEMQRYMDGLIHPVYGKAQWVRLVDVFVLGPAMMYVANRATVSPFTKQFLWWSGLATIVYNGVNYLRLQSLSPADKQRIATLASEMQGKIF